MRDTTTWRGLLPREFRERMAFFSLIFGVPAAAIFELVCVYPYYYEFFTDVFYFHAVVTLFVMTNFYLNLYKVFTVDASGKNSDLPSILKPDWKYCYVCRLNAPPRAYHCPLCEECILKRDHHCPFAGCCVGYHNHRYYLMAVFYAWIAAQYILWMHWTFIWDNLGGLSLYTFWFIVFPQFAFIFRFIGFYQFFIAGIQMGSITTLAVSTYMLISQTVLIVRGQTQHEFLQNIRSYNLGFKRNLMEVLGTRWFLTWISPFIPSPLFGDGLKFPLANEYESMKDM